MEQVVLIITAMLAGIAAYAINIELGKGGVLGAALVSLVCGLLFPPLFGELGSSMALVAATASYAGMVSKSNVCSLGEMAVVGGITGLLYLAAAPAYPGVGGKLGTIAAISCLSFVGYKRLFAGLVQQDIRRLAGGQM
ncbi:MAG TPA: hypothetical protein GX735_08715 [Firmicutes bacterium]|jgi:hypothetical protein|nr:hypothetical protein [Bacillota bacterium]